MSSSVALRAARLIVFPPKVLNCDFSVLRFTLKNLEAISSILSPDNPLLHKNFGYVRMTVHPFIARFCKRSSIASSELLFRL